MVFSGQHIGIRRDLHDAGILAASRNERRQCNDCEFGFQRIKFLSPVRHDIQYTSTSTAACCADFTTSSNFSSWVFGSFSLAETSGTDSRKPKRKLLLTA